jgi:hypothetical protein
MIKVFTFKLERSNQRWHLIEPWAKIKNKLKINLKTKDFMGKTNLFFGNLALGNFYSCGYIWELYNRYMKNKFTTHFEQKFTTCSYGAKIWCAWTCYKGCEICSSFVQKKKIKKLKRFSSHKVPNINPYKSWGSRSQFEAQNCRFIWMHSCL